MTIYLAFFKNRFLLRKHDPSFKKKLPSFQRYKQKEKVSLCYSNNTYNPFMIQMRRKGEKKKTMGKSK